MYSKKKTTLEVLGRVERGETSAFREGIVGNLVVEMGNGSTKTSQAGCRIVSDANSNHETLELSSGNCSFCLNKISVPSKQILVQNVQFQHLVKWN